MALGLQHWSVVTTVVGWTVAAYAWLRKMRAEARYKEIQRRAEAPYLIPTSFTAHAIADRLRYVDMVRHGENFAAFSESLGSHGLEMHQGFNNQGQKVRAISIRQPSRITLVNVGPVISEGASPGWIGYVYEHNRKGDPERFSLQFESFGGFKQVHVYEIVHGEHSLKRVDPP